MPYDPRESRRPIRAQNSGSRGSKGPHAAPNRHTKGPGMWNKHWGTRVKPQEEVGGGGAHLAVGRPPWSTEWAQAPPTFPLDRKLPHTFL